MTNILIDSAINKSIDEEKWINLKLDSQVLTTMMSCELKTDLRFNKHLVPIQGMPSAIERGSLAHEWMKPFNKALMNNMPFNDALTIGEASAKKYAATMLNTTPADVLESYDVMREYCDYQRRYTYQILAVEHPIKYLAYENPEKKIRIYLTGIIDTIVRDNTYPILPIDYKTSGRRSVSSILNNQFIIYCLGLGSLNLIKANIGWQKSVAADEKFRPQTISYFPAVLEHWRTKILPFWCERLIENTITNTWVENFTSCDNYSGCEFSDKQSKYCSSPNDLKPLILQSRFKEGIPWNPDEV